MMMMLTPYKTIKTSFPTPTAITTPGDKILMLSNELKRQKIQSLQDHLGVQGNYNLADFDKLKLTRNEPGNAMLNFWNGSDWVKLTDKRTGEFLAKSSLQTKMGGVYAMRNLLGLEETPQRSKRAIKAAERLSRRIWQYRAS